MKNKTRLALLLLILLPFFLNAQANSHSCFADELHQKMLNEEPSYGAKHKAIEQQIYNLSNGMPFANAESTITQAIPVVVHIVHQNGPENISDNQVFDAIEQLNQALANTGIYDPNTGVDTEIEFCLAIRDPQNNASNGINRIESELTNVTVETEDFALKALLQWEPLDYLNIWVAKDGIVVEADFMGSSPDYTKVLVHEVGHYLGLYHTFEGGCTNDDCQLNGDRICDTPPDQSTAPVDCGASINTCNTDEDDTSVNNPFRSTALGGLGDQNDMFINYMDYGDLPCYSAFTAGQKERMTNVLLTSRQSLLESYGCQSPCPLASFNAAFSIDTPNSILVGDGVNFTNTSDPANFYKWSIDNQVISNAMNSSYIFDEEGIFTISLEIRDTINSCESTFEQTIEVVIIRFIC